MSYFCSISAFLLSETAKILLRKNCQKEYFKKVFSVLGFELKHIVAKAKKRRHIIEKLLISCLRNSASRFTLFLTSYSKLQLFHIHIIMFLMPNYVTTIKIRSRQMNYFWPNIIIISASLNGAK